jgi:hypothetical protein
MAAVNTNPGHRSEITLSICAFGITAKTLIGDKCVNVSRET